MWPFRKSPAPTPAPEPKPARWEQAFSTDLLQDGEARARAMRLRQAILDAQPPTSRTSAMDACVFPEGENGADDGSIPDAVLGWFTSGQFLGYQNLAVIAQNWLIDKACAMPARDAVRHGFDLTLSDAGGQEESGDLEKRINELNREQFALSKHLVEFVRFGRVFGIRHVLFDVRPKGVNINTWRENPFNFDAVSPGSYRGLVQIDPYWMAPEMSAVGTSDPTDPDFYEPEWWNVMGRRIHRSHFAIFVPNPIADILKPLYLYGGVSVPQRILERVYAAERTANEAPQLAMSKRLDVLKTDLAGVMANHENFQQNMQFRSRNMNNYGIQVVDTDDTLERHDTALTDLDVTVMTQYQLVAAAANVPATKLLGTTPKGFNATGEYEESSYHEELETIQNNDLTPLVERHIQLLMKSEGLDDSDEIKIVVNWLPVDSPTAKEVAEIQELESRRDVNLVNAGAIDGLDVRNRLIADRRSGYADLSEETEADEEEIDDRPPGDIPEETVGKSS